MASKGGPPLSQGLIKKCKLCEQREDARYYCETCDLYMCKMCKETHNQAGDKQSHTVVLAASDYDSEFQIIIGCSMHPRKKADWHCKTCDQTVCDTCSHDGVSHNCHLFDKVENVKERYKLELRQIVMETREEISEVEESLQLIQSYLKDYTKLTDTTITDINTERQIIKSQADEIADNLIREMEKRKEEDLKNMKNKIKELEKIISVKKDIKHSCQQKIRSSKSASVPPEIKNQLRKQTASYSITYMRPLLFASHGCDLRNILGKLQNQEPVTITSCIPASGINEVGKPPVQCEQTILGTNENVSTRVISSISPGIDCYCVSAINEKEAWCGHGFGCSKNLVLIQTDGKVKKRVKLDNRFYDLTTSVEGDVFITEDQGHMILKYSSEGKISTFSDMKPYKTQGLCMTAAEDLLVCLCKENDNKVTRVSMDGEIKQNIPDDQQKTLFKNPQLVTENINGDICVVDGLNKVIIVNKDGRLKFTYPDADHSEHTLEDCHGITCDKLGYILVSDWNNNEVHQINSEGQFVKFVLTYEHDIQEPWGLSIDDNGQLWVGNDGGIKVTVYKYRS